MIGLRMVDGLFWNDDRVAVSIFVMVLPASLVSPSADLLSVRHGVEMPNTDKQNEPESDLLPGLHATSWPIEQFCTDARR